MKVTCPQQLPDFRLWLLDQWRPGGRLFELAGSAAATGWQFFDDGARAQLMDPLVNVATLQRATLWWVTAEMVELISRAAATLPPTTLTDELLADQAGLVVFEVPLMGTTADTGQPIPTHAMGWQAGRMRATGDESLGITPYLYSHEIWVPSGLTNWVFGSDTEAPPVEGFAEQRVTSMAEERRWLATLWLLASEPLADVSVMPAERHLRRRSQREKVSSDVRLVDLRAPKRSRSDRAGEPTGRHWGHRTIVGEATGGFWRQQVYGPNRSLRRPKWIYPYMAGPGDAPLRVGPIVKVVRDRRDT